VRTYEAVYVFRPEADLIEKGRQAIKEEYSRVGATVAREQDMGERQLAYVVDKQERGHYYLFVSEIDPDKVGELENSLKLRPELLKYLFVRKDD
jgi:small subunit ribosomal protein S6